VSGRVAVVTGGGAGIGEAICRRLAADGARVAVLDVDGSSAGRVAAAIGGLAVPVDVAESEAVDSALDEVEASFGPVDVWVNNAGIPAAEQAQRVNPRAAQQLDEMDGVKTPLEGLVRLPDDEWRRMLSVHLDGTFFGTRAAARSMTARGAGAIVNIASICGIEGCAGFPHYSAAKGGILAFTRSVARELSVQGVRVNAVAPGFVETGSRAQSDPLRAAIRRRTPLGRFGTPEEVAATVAFLASDEASFFVGATLSPNGGLLMS
jgi:3-oxoacyl-[acyl-carrier protein] reductase